METRSPDTPPTDVRTTASPSQETLILRVAAAALLVSLCAIGVTAAAAAVAGVPHSSLTREPQVVLGGLPYIGFLSNVGGVVWSVATTVCLLAATLTTGAKRGMFAAAGVVSGLLLADDLFLLHDWIYPKLGIDEAVVAVGYFVLIGLLVLRFRRQIGRVGVLGIGVAVGMWGVSAGLDQFLNSHPVNLDQLTEDGAKLVGISIRAAVWSSLAHVSLRPADR